MLCLALAVPQRAVSAEPVAGEAFELHKKGQYEQAAARGLAGLQSEPSNHELRFIVADSLQRTGKTEQAIQQFEALEGTPFAAAATIRLNALRPAGSPGRKLSSKQAAVTPTNTSKFPEQYQYVQPSGAGLFGTNQPQTVFAQRPAGATKKWNAAEQRILDLSAKGDYQAAGTEGLALLAAQKTDDELVLAIANSLAWTGRNQEAIATYQKLERGEYANDGMVGRANIIRWGGRDDLAVPMYRAVLASESSNAGALEGLEMAVRELRPKTTISFGGSIDSSEMKRRSVTVNHRWRDASGANSIEVETSAVRDRMPAIQAEQQDVTLRYRALGLALKPSLELSMPTNEQRTLFGSASVRLGENPDTLVEIGRVNWGRIATNANALAAHLAASHLGVEAAQSFFFGKLTGRADYFGISDGNRILTSSLRLASNWRPLGANIKPYLGIETRDATFHSTSYWSPEEGYGTFYGGLLGEWGRADWNLYASGQVGFPLYGEAARSWSASAGGKRWISNDLALSMNLWAMDSWRDNAAYRAKAVNLNLEKLWR